MRTCSPGAISPPFDFLVASSHMMGIPFFFGNFQTDTETLFRFAWSEDYRADRQAVSDTVSLYVSNFIRTGSPNEPRPIDVTWQAWSNERRGAKRLELGLQTQMLGR